MLTKKLCSKECFGTIFLTSFEMTIAADHLNNILSTIDDKETLNEIKLTINAARSISTKIDDMSDDFEKLTQDKELTKSIRDLTIGLSKFLNEIYP